MFGICVSYSTSNKGWINWELSLSGKTIVTGKPVTWPKHLFSFDFIILSLLIFELNYSNLIYRIWLIAYTIQINRSPLVLFQCLKRNWLTIHIQQNFTESALKWLKVNSFSSSVLIPPKFLLNRSGWWRYIDMMRIICWPFSLRNMLISKLFGLLFS